MKKNGISCFVINRCSWWTSQFKDPEWRIAQCCQFFPITSASLGSNSILCLLARFFPVHLRMIINSITTSMVLLRELKSHSKTVDASLNALATNDQDNLRASPGISSISSMLSMFLSNQSRIKINSITISTVLLPELKAHFKNGRRIFECASPGIFSISCMLSRFLSNQSRIKINSITISTVLLR